MPVWKKLFAESGNICAFTDCPKTLFRTDGVSDVQIAHINAVNVGGPRHEKGLPVRRLNSASNLLLMCRAHHAHIDQMPVTIYTESKVREMKVAHTLRIEKAMESLLSTIVNVVAENAPIAPVTFSAWLAVSGRGESDFHDDERAALLLCLSTLATVPRQSLQVLQHIMATGDAGVSTESLTVGLSRLSVFTSTPSNELRIHIDILADAGLVYWNEGYDDGLNPVVLVTTSGPADAPLEYLRQFAEVTTATLEDLIVSLDWRSLDTATLLPEIQRLRESS